MTHPLTPRQQQILDALDRGLSEPEVAGELGISRHTVHAHVRTIYLICGVNRRARLLRWSFEHRHGRAVVQTVRPSVTGSMESLRKG